MNGTATWGKLGLLILIVFAMTLGITIGKQTGARSTTNKSLEVLIEQCIASFGYTREKCEKLARDSTEYQNKETQKANNKNSDEVTKENYLAGCTAQSATLPQCECGFDKVINRYGYVGFREIVNEMSQSEINNGDLENSQKVSEFIEFMKSDEMKSCVK